MPRRSILSATERESLLALPEAKDELIRLYTFNDTDLSRIGLHRGASTPTLNSCSHLRDDAATVEKGKQSLRQGQED